MNSTVNSKRRVGILLCDDLHEELQTRWSSYLALFEELIDDEPADLTAVGYRVHDDEWPAGPEAADAWLITGSRASVHEDPGWIAPLQALVRQIDAAAQPLVGVCFGHQLIHAALGGRTGRSGHGWHLGSYPVACEAPFADRNSGEPLHLMSVHQDQVLEPAPGFRRLASSAEVPWYAGYRDHVFTIQGHPEFDREFFQALMQRVREKAGDAAVEEALAGLPAQDDTPAVRRFMRDWLRGHHAPGLPV